MVAPRRVTATSRLTRPTNANQCIVIPYPFDQLFESEAMKSSHITSFAAGILVGAIGFGGIAVHARMVTLNAAIGGVLPNSEGSLFCVSTASALRPIKGVPRESRVRAPGGSDSIGVTMRCPA